MVQREVAEEGGGAAAQHPPTRQGSGQAGGRNNELQAGFALRALHVRTECPTSLTTFRIRAGWFRVESGSNFVMGMFFPQVSSLFRIYQSPGHEISAKACDSAQKTVPIVLSVADLL